MPVVDLKMQDGFSHSNGSDSGNLEWELEVLHRAKVNPDNNRSGSKGEFENVQAL
jgi:hypothetical protein